LLAQVGNIAVPDLSGRNTDNSAAAASPSSEVEGRMARLEAETQALRTEVQRLREQAVRLPTVDATPASMSNATAMSEAAAAPAGQ
jgi:hypothetical protein